MRCRHKDSGSAANVRETWMIVDLRIQLVHRDQVYGLKSHRTERKGSPYCVRFIGYDAGEILHLQHLRWSNDQEETTASYR